MAPSTERLLLQLLVVLACIVPLLAGGSGVLHGPRIGHLATPSTDLDSHFRYLSGLLFGIGLAFLTTVPAIERRGARFRLLGGIVVIGGCGRLLSLLSVGAPPTVRFSGWHGAGGRADPDAGGGACRTPLRDIG